MNKLSLEGLRAMFDGDWEMAVAVLESFCRTMKDLETDLAKAENQWENKVELKRVVHAIKGAVAIFPDSEISKKAAQIDQDLKKNAESVERTEVALLRKLGQSALAYVESILKSGVGF